MPECIAEPLSRNDIRRKADVIRVVEGCTGSLYFDIIHFIEITLPKIDDDFSFVVKSKSELGECHGLTFPERNEMQIREDVYNRACNGSGRDRLTIAHELFHLLQHTMENISFARSDGGVKTYMSPEWQADAFGGELLIPHDLIQGMTPEEISEKCKVSLSAAKCQMSK